jgi:pimeloyl-ACP methyl ester carboxylesterase
MQKLDKKVHIIAPCLRGMGYSTLNEPISRLETLTEDIFFLLYKKFLFNENIYVVGSGLGAIVALNLA